jgi:hypothetical protein
LRKLKDMAFKFIGEDGVAPKSIAAGTENHQPKVVTLRTATAIAVTATKRKIFFNTGVLGLARYGACGYYLRVD